MMEPVTLFATENDQYIIMALMKNCGSLSPTQRTPRGPCSAADRGGIRGSERPTRLVHPDIVVYLSL
jgi:hypothetical protein